MTILALVCLRLGCAGIRPPPLPESLAGWQRSLARSPTRCCMHFCSRCRWSVGYLIRLPSDRDLVWTIRVSQPGGTGRGTGQIVQDCAYAAAWLLLAVAGIHALAAFWHHLVLKDQVLLRMLPRRVADSSQRADMKHLCIAFMAGVFLPAASAADCWTPVPENSKIAFNVTQAAPLCRVTFAKYTGSVCIDRADAGKDHMRVEVDTASVDTNYQSWIGPARQ